MGIEKLFNRLDDFFDQSKKKQKKKAEKLSKIITALEEKKIKLKIQIKAEALKCKKSKQTYNLCKEFKALVKILKKAKKQESLIR